MLVYCVHFILQDVSYGLLRGCGGNIEGLITALYHICRYDLLESMLGLCSSHTLHQVRSYFVLVAHFVIVLVNVHQKFFLDSQILDAVAICTPWVEHTDNIRIYQLISASHNLLIQWWVPNSSKCITGLSNIGWHWRRETGTLYCICEHTSAHGWQIACTEVSKVLIPLLCKLCCANCVGINYMWVACKQI